ncbi:MAG: methyltransferase [Myxococcales bacterium]|nr:methyltransferase [Myxococcales bacterium]
MTPSSGRRRSSPPRGSSAASTSIRDARADRAGGRARGPRRARRARRILDLCAGIGPLALWAAARWPAAAITAVESNLLACACLRENAAARGLGGRIEVLAQDGLGDISAPAELALINPPTHAGEEELRALLAPLPRLLAGGVALFVVNRHGRLVGLLDEIGAATSIHAVPGFSWSAPAGEPAGGGGRGGRKRAPRPPTGAPALAILRRMAEDLLRTPTAGTDARGEATPRSRTPGPDAVDDTLLARPATRLSSPPSVDDTLVAPAERRSSAPPGAAAAVDDTLLASPPRGLVSAVSDPEARTLPPLAAGHEATLLAAHDDATTGATGPASTGGRPRGSAATW